MKWISYCRCLKYCESKKVVGYWLDESKAYRWRSNASRVDPPYLHMTYSRGPRIILIISCALLLGGYFGIKHLYDSGLSPDTSTLPALSFYILLLCKFLTVSGGLGGLTIQLVWSLRASDYLHSFSSLSPMFKSTTSKFLLILALSTSSLMALGIFVRPIPLPEPSAPQSLEDGDDVQEALLLALSNDLNSMEVRPVCYTPTDINTDEQPSNSVWGVMEVTWTLVRWIFTGKHF